MHLIPRLQAISRRNASRPHGRRPVALGLEHLESRNLLSIYPLSPATTRAVYGFNALYSGVGTNDGTGVTIAIVDAYDDSKIFADLDKFDQTYGPVAGGATYYSLYGASSSFLTKRTPQGQPKSNPGWALEIALDVEWAHAIAPGARIILEEARSNSLADLFGAVDDAVAQGASVVSMSFGSNEFASEASYDSHFNRSNVAFVASSGDTGGVTGYPSMSPYIISVGGTSLNLDSSGNLQSETGWSGSGGGYSSVYSSQPSYQQTYASTNDQGNTVLSGQARANPDVSYDGDPNTGFAVYDTVRYQGHSGWWQVGGTSAGAPQWAALIAIADQGRSGGALDTATTLSKIYGLAANSSSYAANFRDITTGNNPNPNVAGYDLVTGVGSPHAEVLIPNLRTAAPQPATIVTSPSHSNAPKPALGKVPPTGSGTISPAALALLLESEIQRRASIPTVTPPAPASLPPISPPAVLAPTVPVRVVPPLLIGSGGGDNAIVSDGDNGDDEWPVSPWTLKPGDGAPAPLPASPERAPESGPPPASPDWPIAATSYFESATQAADIQHDRPAVAAVEESSAGFEATNAASPAAWTAVLLGGWLIRPRGQRDDERHERWLPG